MKETPKNRCGAKSQALRESASTLIPAAVHAAYPPWPATAAGPPAFSKAKGAVLTDIDGNDYVDYCCGYGALILGHADERVTVAVNKALSKGCAYAALSEAEVRLAELIVSRYASIDMVRFDNSTGDAIRTAIGLASAYTGRRHLVQLGSHHDSGTEALAAPYNDIAAVETLFAERGTQIAAILVEPASISLGLTLPSEGFLPGLRRLCDTHGALLVFDESTVGLRITAGGASAVYSVIPDLVVLGPVLGGGLPLTACGGRRDIMSRATQSLGQRFLGHPAPSPAALAAGIATLQAVGEPEFYTDLQTKSVRLAEGLQGVIAAAVVKARISYVNSIIGIFFADPNKESSAPTRSSNVGLAAYFFDAMLNRGVFLTPSQQPIMFLTAAHTDAQIDDTIEAVHAVLADAPL
ncbi:MAG: aminotransferase class III-fold pyridoxal phosphate-dependent enzyme [Phycisphaerales bacterium]|nr:MAG: aminotransferase class III-fold pyridoxal phosphate-dependent enzyme [Phycisphaerales bacterium]